ncbi:hypothetical protein [Kosakonia sp. S42]|nr:hypothetical protein [Kosakonia sp. S42]MBK0018906.1 hypothetical protein [Kosakonia sp. S42]
MSFSSQYGGQIYLILDEAPHHRASLAQNRAMVMNIERHCLPPYSPESD